MINLRNFGSVEGRLAADPVAFKNNDGSHKVLVTLYVDNNFKTKGEFKSNKLQFEAYVPASVQNLGFYGTVHTGDLIALSYHQESDSFADKNGEMRYMQKSVIDSTEYRESRAVTQARYAQRQTQAAVPAAQAQAPANTVDPSTIGAGEPSPFQNQN